MNTEKDPALVQQKQSLNEQIHNMIKERTDKVLVLGELTYKSQRQSHSDDKQFEQLYEDIFQIDQAIAAAKRDLAQLMNQSDTSTCECGNEVGEMDQFCGECGAKVVHATRLSEEEQTMCSTCEAMIPYDASFCTVCGHAVKKGG